MGEGYRIKLTWASTWVSIHHWLAVWPWASHCFSGPQFPYLKTVTLNITSSLWVVRIQRGTTPDIPQAHRKLAVGVGTRYESGWHSVCLGCFNCLVMGTVT